MEIIHNEYLERELRDSKFGFGNAMGTKEASFDSKLYVCKTDVKCLLLDKAFDKFRRNNLTRLLRENNIDSKVVRIIADLFFNETAADKLGEDFSVEIA